MSYPLNGRGGWMVPDNTVIPKSTEIPALSVLGDWCTLGEECTLEGGAVSRWLTLSNVDGSGRQVLIILRPDGAVAIRAGCRLCGLEEFVEAALSEGKPYYAAVIPAVVSAMQSARQ